ncbi:hypothetical protein ACIODX_38030 [Streptomyces sp. NPDC088190]|uniref:hypothetical protein n=1 Tax=unclassified Streptomyces TaxID=2593676 RepID=UPI002E76C273|nr:hypothetical protein [Streptomyces sp. JV190]MEE1838392.1 hypothetical protein [Streptomyces sp. JV190]
MDSGLAAVLGAIVGAVGTGATGVATALLGRSAARHQTQIETLRTLRESRKAACLTFAEVAERYLDLLSTTLLPIGRIERFPEQRENLIANAHNHWKRALRYRQNEVQRARTVLALEATRPVADAATACSAAFALLSYAAGNTIAGLKGEELDSGPLKPPNAGFVDLLAENGMDGHNPDLELLRKQAAQAYTTFLQTAADALGETALTPAR